MEIPNSSPERKGVTQKEIHQPTTTTHEQPKLGIKSNNNIL
jgi:hypothetical protein